MASFGNSDVDKYYAQFLAALPVAQIDYNPITTEQKTQDEFAASYAAYMAPAYEQSIKKVLASADAQRASYDADAASRGMGTSTWLSDVKGRVSQGAQSDIASLSSQYQANLGTSVSEAYQNQLNRLLTVATQNEQNRLSVQSANESEKIRLEQLAYQRALEAISLEGIGSGSGGGTDSIVITDKGGVTQEEFMRSIDRALGKRSTDTVTKNPTYVRLP